MRGNKRLERFRTNQGCVARQDDNKLRSAQSAARDLHRMSRAVLRLLQHSLCFKRFNHRRYLLRLVSHNDNRLPRAQWRARANDVFDKRAPASAVQHLCEA
jgi:hypothetical protein